MGRPSKISPDVQKRICDGIRLGMTYKLAAARGGVTYETLRTWMRKGEKAPNGQYAAFLDAVKRADSDCVDACLASIQQAARKVQHWQAAAWLLERRHGYTRPEHVVPVEDGQVGGDARIEDIERKARELGLLPAVDPGGDEE